MFFKKNVFFTPWFYKALIHQTWLAAVLLFISNTRAVSKLFMSSKWLFWFFKWPLNRWESHTHSHGTIYLKKKQKKPQKTLAEWKLHSSLQLTFVLVAFLFWEWLVAGVVDEWAIAETYVMCFVSVSAFWSWDGEMEFLVEMCINKKINKKNCVNRFDLVCRANWKMYILFIT